MQLYIFYSRHYKLTNPDEYYRLVTIILDSHKFSLRNLQKIACTKEMAGMGMYAALTGGG